MLNEIDRKSAVKELVAVCTEGNLNYKEWLKRLNACESPKEIYDLLKRVHIKNEEIKLQKQCDDFKRFVDTSFDQTESIPLCELFIPSQQFDTACEALKQVKSIVGFKDTHSHEMVKEEDRSYNLDSDTYKAESYDTLGDVLDLYNNKFFYYSTITLALNNEGNLLIHTTDDDPRNIGKYVNDYECTVAVYRQNNGKPVKYNGNTLVGTETDEPFRALYETTNKINSIQLYDLINDTLDKVKGEKSVSKQMTDD